jgi:hypothetical protein
MIGHQAPRMAAPAEAVEHLRQHGEKGRPVSVVQIDVRAGVAPRRHVIERAGKFDAKGTGHGARLTRRNSQFKT